MLHAEATGSERTTFTDVDGRYAFEGLPPGAYTVRADKAGFVPRARAGGVDAEVELRPGQAAVVDLPMQRGAALEGRVLDESGNPVPRQMVSIARARSSRAGEPNLEDEAETLTDKLGRFRAHTLPAGDYVIHAESRTSGDRYYYPGTRELADARILTVGVGQTFDGLECVLPSGPPGAASEAGVDASSPNETHGVGAYLTGQVFQPDSGLPAANVSVRAVGRTMTANGHTDERGRFELVHLRPGSYVLIAGGPGPRSALTFTTSRALPDALTVEVREGDQLRNLTLTAMRPNSMEGRVVDEFGDPVPGVVVQILQRVFGSNRWHLARTVDVDSAGPTDDLGRFRFYDVRPGEHYLNAVPAPFSTTAQSASPEIVRPSGFQLTYYPSTNREDAARPVVIAFGEDVRGIVVRLIPTAVGALSGVVLDPAGLPVARAGVQLVGVEGGSARTDSLISTSSTEQGVFEFQNVPVGDYVLQATGTDLFASTPVTIDAVSGLRPPFSLYLSGPVTVRGRLTVEGGGPPLDQKQVAVTIYPTGPLRGPATGSLRIRWDDAWRFELSTPWSSGVLRAPRLPQGWALKAVTLDGRDITDRPTDFESVDVRDLEIQLTWRVGGVRGTVTDDLQPAMDCGVILFADDPSTWRYPERFVRIYRSVDGTFKFDDLLPGTYRVIAIPEAIVGDIDPAWPASKAPGATVVMVAEGSTQTVNLSLSKR